MSATITDIRDALAGQLRTMQTAEIAERIEALLDEQEEIRLRYPWSERKANHVAYLDHVPIPVAEHDLSDEDAARLGEIAAEKEQLEEAITKRLTGEYVGEDGRRCFAPMEHAPGRIEVPGTGPDWTLRIGIHIDQSEEAA